MAKFANKDKVNNLGPYAARVGAGLSLAEAIKANKQNNANNAPVASAPIVTSTVKVARKASKTPNKTNLAGGVQYTMSDKMEFVTGVFATMLSGGKDKNKELRIYETEEARIARLGALARKFPFFAAKVLLSARIQHGLRTVVYALAPYVFCAASGEPWVATWLGQLFVRLDDPSETAAALWKFIPGPHRADGKKRKLPNAFKKGFNIAIGKADDYRIAKYGTKTLSPSLADLVNMCRPTPNKKNMTSLYNLAKGRIKQIDTWETELSNAAAKGKTKKEVWDGMVLQSKLGQLGLLRNLRNIAENCSGKVVAVALDQLRDAEAIRKNGILPMQYKSAYEAIKASTLPQATMIAVLAALDDAVETAAGNVPSLGKRVLLCIDESSSMHELERNASAMMAATLLKANPQADLMAFATGARYVNVNRKLPLLELMQEIRNNLRSGGTNFNTIFRTANKAYDSIVILSDQEGWVKDTSKDDRDQAGAPVKTSQDYRRVHNCNPTIFMFDVGGDGSLMFREDGIILLAGFSFEVFRLLNILKEDRTKLVDVIDKIEIGHPLPRGNEEKVED
jgi:60 kDa SS-A/Ro ribonucleoprotein